MNKYILTSIWIIILSAGSIYGQENTLFEQADFIIEHLDSANSIASEIGPSVVGNQLYYSSVRKSWWEKAGRLRKNIAFYNQYMVPLDTDGKQKEGIGRKLVQGLGEDYHQGPVSYCAKTGELFVTESNTTDPDSIRRMIPKANIRLKLVIMKNKSGVWEKTSELPFNDKRYHFAHPAISITGDTLVFSSDMPGGKGESDLYMSIRNSGSWSSPVNLGDKINTTGNEMFPTFLPGGLLSFSSNGHPGNYGLLDIYYTSFPLIGGIRNAGDKINSAFDDFGLVIAPGAKTGYFSSNRPGSGSDDIYRLDIVKRVQILSGRVYDARSREPLPGATVTLRDCQGKELKQLTSDGEGSFKAEIPSGACLVVKAGKSGYTEIEEPVNGRNFIELYLKKADSYQLQVLDAQDRKPLGDVKADCKGTILGQTSPGGTVSLDAQQSSGCQLHLFAEGYLNQTHSYVYREGQGTRIDTVYMYKKEIGKKFVLKNINYDYDKWDILPESEIELNKLVQVMKDNPALKVELGSHTDARGSDAYNMRLSQRRSDSAVSYIMSKGIDKSRIKAKGYGETQLINRCKNGVECPDWEHRQNRRTEFKIIGL